MDKVKRYIPYLLLTGLTLFFCRIFVGRYGIFGAKVDWLSQHSVLPDYFRQQFYATGKLFPEFAANCDPVFFSLFKIAVQSIKNQ